MNDIRYVDKSKGSKVFGSILKGIGKLAAACTGTNIDGGTTSFVDSMPTPASKWQEQRALATSRSLPKYPHFLKRLCKTTWDAFVERLQAHFDDMLANGREVVLDMRIFDSSNITFENNFTFAHPPLNSK